MVNTLETLRISRKLKEEQQAQIQQQASQQQQAANNNNNNKADGTLTGNKEDDAKALDAISTAIIDKLTSDEKFSEAVGKAITPLLEKFGEELVSKLKGEGEKSEKNDGNSSDDGKQQQQSVQPQQQQSQSQDQQQQQ